MTPDAAEHRERALLVDVRCGASRSPVDVRCGASRSPVDVRCGASRSRWTRAAGEPLAGGSAWTDNLAVSPVR